MSVVAAVLVYNTYPLTATMIVLLALSDDIPITTIASDNVKLESKPVRWQMGRMLMLPRGAGRPRRGGDVGAVPPRA